MKVLQIAALFALLVSVAVSNNVQPTETLAQRIPSRGVKVLAEKIPSAGLKMLGITCSKCGGESTPIRQDKKNVSRARSKHAMLPPKQNPSQKPHLGYSHTSPLVSEHSEQNSHFERHHSNSSIMHETKNVSPTRSKHAMLPPKPNPNQKPHLGYSHTSPRVSEHSEQNSHFERHHSNSSIMHETKNVSPARSKHAMGPWVHSPDLKPSPRKEKSWYLESKDNIQPSFPKYSSMGSFSPNSRRESR